MSGEYFRELDCNREDLSAQVEGLQERLTNDQREVYIAVLEIVEQRGINNNNENNRIFLDAPGGTGKSFVVNTLLKKVWS